MDSAEGGVEGAAEGEEQERGKVQEGVVREAHTPSSASPAIAQIPRRFRHRPTHRFRNRLLPRRKPPFAPDEAIGEVFLRRNRKVQPTSFSIFTFHLQSTSFSNLHPLQENATIILIWVADLIEIFFLYFQSKKKTVLCFCKK